MDGAEDQTPLAALRAVESSPGVQSIYRIPHVDGSAAFAAKLKLDSACVVSGNLTHGILACRIAGAATLVRRSGGISRRGRPRIGSVTYAAPDIVASYSGDGSCEVCHVYIQPDALQSFAASETAGAPLPRIDDLFAIEDPWLKGYFQMLLTEFELGADGEQRADALFITQAQHLLIHHLLRVHSGAASRATNALPRVVGVAALRTMTLKRVQEYIDANLAGDIALADLAAIACMSTGHFLRAFRAATGTTPYHYVLEQRLCRASSLLRSTTLPVSRIAEDCGFKTPSQLSSKFRAQVGISPSRYRLSARGGVASTPAGSRRLFADAAASLVSRRSH